MKRVIEGYSYERIKGGTVDIPPLRGGFRYCRLGEPLFTAEGHIREGVTFRELAAHIFIAETGRPLPHPPGPGSPLLGTAENRAVCLLWGDGGSVLDRRALAALPQGGDVKIVYADSCLIPQEHLREAGVVFKQIPYSVRTC